MEFRLKMFGRAAAAIVAVVVAAASYGPRPASGQIVTACTSSMISSFTPCLNYLTGSTNGGSSATADCCGALAGLLSSSSDCGCMILTGNVPFSLPINRSLAIRLPRVCSSRSVSLFRCKDAMTQMSPPGPPAGGLGLPTLPPFPNFPPTALPPPVSSLPASPADAPSASDEPGADGLGPFVLPSSSVRSSIVSLLAALAGGALLLATS